MRTTIITAIAIAATALFTQSASAAFTSLSVQSFQTTLSGQPRTVHRLWANFTSPSDGITSWGAVGTDLTIQNIQANGQLSVNGFLNAGGNGDYPPPQGDPSAQFDSYYTINGFGEPGPFPMPAITDGVVTLSAPQDMASIFVTPDSPWALAGWLGGPPRILLMQALVTGGEHIRGTIGFNTVGAEAVIVATFNSVPGPSAMMVMIVAGMCGARRRR